MDFYSITKKESGLYIDKKEDNVYVSYWGKEDIEEDLKVRKQEQIDNVLFWLLENYYAEIKENEIEFSFVKEVSEDIVAEDFYSSGNLYDFGDFIIITIDIWN